jgi:predicted Zn-dependent protease
MRRPSYIFALVLLFLNWQVAPAQIPRILKGGIDKVDKVTGKMKEVEITTEEELELGTDVSERLRAKYGVVQDAGIHRYVSLVGAVIKEKCGRTDLPFQFIVLDTDGVNAFATPGGFIHITRGALSLMKTEAELAGVLAHEMAHVTQKHTIRAIQKGKLVQIAAGDKSISANPVLFQRLKDETYKVVFAGFSREDELESDERGITFAATAGYFPGGLSQFLDALKQRNANSNQTQGLFDSHPQMEERLQKLAAIQSGRKWTSTIEARERLAKSITCPPVALASVAQAEEGAAGLAGEGQDSEKKDNATDTEKKPSRFSLSRIKNPLSSKGATTQSAEVTGSGGSRGLDRERGAKGGASPALVPIIITAADLNLFKREINLNPV